MDAADVESDLVEVLYTEAQIQARLAELAHADRGRLPEDWAARTCCSSASSAARRW